MGSMLKVAKVAKMAKITREVYLATFVMGPHATWEGGKVGRWERG